MAKSDGHELGVSADESRYGDELLRANWNPVIELLQCSCDHAAEATHTAAADVSDEEAAAFLGRIYTHCA
jgi:hypothetical protein